MKKRIFSFVLMLAVMVSTAVVPVTVQADMTLNEAADTYAEVLQDYAEKTVKEKLGHSYSFALAYIDEDDMPEMLICYDNGRMTYTTIFTIKNNELKQQETFDPYGNLIFSPKKNIIQINDLRFGFESILFTTYNSDSGFISIHSFDNNTYGTADMYDIDYLYGIDGKGVSEEYYNSELAAITDAYDWVTFSPNTGESFEVTVSNIADMKENPTKYILGYAPITVYLDNEQLSFDQDPVMANDRVLVPMRAIFEAMGAAVTWYDDTQTVVAEKNGRVCSMTIGVPEIKCTANGKTETTALDVAPQLVGDRTMVPVRAVAEAFSAEVTWNDSEQSVNIKSN